MTDPDLSHAENAERVEEVARQLPTNKHDLCRKFARGKVTVMRGCWPEPHGFVDRFYPRLAGRNVRPRCMPKTGYLTRAAAIAGGKAFRDECRAVAAHLQAQEAGGK